MFRDMRRKKQQLSDEECQAVLERGTSGVLAVIGDEGYPYTVPMSYVFAQDKIYLHSATSGHKVDAIRNDSHCSFCVIAQDEVHPETFTTHFKSVIAFGQIHIVEDDAEQLAALRLLGRRHAPHDEAGLQHEIDKDFSRVLMLRLDIEHLTGKQAIEMVTSQ